MSAIPYALNTAADFMGWDHISCILANLEFLTLTTSQQRRESQVRQAHLQQASFSCYSFCMTHLAKIQLGFTVVTDCHAQILLYIWSAFTLQTLGKLFNLSSDKHILWHWILHFEKKLKVECGFSTGNFWFQASCGMWKRVLQYSPVPWSSTNDCSLCDLLCSTLWPSKKSSNLSFHWENWVTCKLATGRVGGYCWEELLHTDD